MKKTSLIFLIILNICAPKIILAAIIIISPPPSCNPELLNNQVSEYGDTFHFKSFKYLNGLLSIAFSYNPQQGQIFPSPDSFFFQGQIVKSSDCTYVGINSGFGYVYPSLPAGQYSIRFINDFSFKIYDDSTNLAVDCEGCSYSFGYTAEPPFRVNFNFGVENRINENEINPSSLDINLVPIREPVENKVPILIVPGILGTNLNGNDGRLWLDLQHNLSDIGDQFMDQLEFNEQLVAKQPEIHTDGIIKKETANLGIGVISLFDYTDGLTQEFANQGYVENTDLFTFPYDWRYGVSGKIADSTTTADLLKAKIDEILSQTHSDKINIVAHSTGGLLVKKYVMDHPNDHRIDKAIFVGVPNTGAPKAIKTLLQGDNFNIPWLADSEIKKIAQNLPVIYDLAPTTEYFNNKGSFYKLTEIKSLLTTTVTDLNYDQSWQLMLNEHGANSSGVNNSQNLHSSAFDNYDLRTAGIDAYNIVGCKAATVSKIKEIHYKNFFGQPSVDYSAPEESPGDGTVPLESATNFPVNQDHKFYALKADHSKMLSQPGIRQTIVNLLTGSQLAVSQKDITQDLGKCKLNGKAIEIFSPVDINIADQDGNHLGLAADGSTQNNIANADFEIWNGHKFIFLPTDENQTYDVKLKGTGEGSFTLKTQDIIDNQISDTQIFSNLPVNVNLAGTVNIGAPTTQVDLDYNGDGIIDQTILPSSILDENQSQDLVPPVSTSTVDGLIGEPGFYRSGVNITLNSDDPVIAGHESETSGVLNTTYQLDGQTKQVYTGPINITSEGKHNIIFFSTDKAGNMEEPQSITFTVDKTAPEFALQFDPKKKDLNFSGQDNISTSSDLTILDEGNLVTITDQAGNTTQIGFEQKNRKASSRAQIKSFTYNGEKQDINKNSFGFVWLYDKSGNLKFLSQDAKSKNDFNILAVFSGKKTLLLGRDSTGKIFKTENGLTLLKIFSQNGGLDWAETNL